MLSQYRQDLHQIPELGYTEFETKDYLLKHLKPLRCTIHEINETGLIAYFHHDKEKTIAFRADMDALPILEATGLPYSSTHPGIMHACGHDGHMAILLKLATYIHEFPDKMRHNICLIFQPAEEKEAGARLIVEAGVLQDYKVQAVYGLHLWPGLKQDAIYSKPGDFMSKGSELDIKITGKSSHVANADLGIDSILIASLLISQIYAMERELPEGVKRLVKIGKITGGTARNIISDSVTLQGSVRSFDPEIHQRIKGHIREIAEQLEHGHGCTIDITYHEGYEAVINDPDLFYSTVKKIPRINELQEPVMHSEDFGLYRQICPSLFFFLGVGDTAPLHHPAFNFNESVLETGFELFKDLL